MGTTAIVTPFGLNPDSLPSETHFIAENLKISTIGGDEILAILNYLDGFGGDQLTSYIRKRPCFVMDLKDLAFARRVKSNVALAHFLQNFHRFCIEFFTEGKMVPMAAFILEDKTVLSHSIDPSEIVRPSGSAEQVTLSALEWKSASAYLEFALGVVDKAPLARTALTRLARGIRQGGTEDGAIDLAVGLECLIPAQNEISFQFSLYHSLVYSEEAATRSKAFLALRNLYDLRSKIVHGTEWTDKVDKNFDQLTSDWPLLLSLSRKNLTYYMAFSKNSDDWLGHLRQLAIGGPRLTLEE